MDTFLIIVHGKVQGVYYRKFTKQKADELSIKGTVENKDDGSVEIYAQGSDSHLQKMIYWAHTGSPYSQVDHVISKKLTVQETYASFEIIR